MNMHPAMFIPLIGLICTWLWVRTFDDIDWRIAFVKAMILWATLVFLITEVLSLLQAIGPYTLAITWVVIILWIVVSLIWHRGKLSHLREIVSSRHPFSPSLEASSAWIPVVPILLISVITLVIGLVSPPNNWDSMTYHMSRVEHWRTNGSVSHYPTNSVWQISHNPFSEFVILQFQTLGFGSDRFANLVQWLFFVASMATASSLVGVLGGTRLAQNMSALAVATTPMVIMQATSTQNDLVCGFFVAAVAFFAFKIGVHPNKWDRAYLSLALALAIVTKGTAYVLLPPFIIWALWVTYTTSGIRATLAFGQMALFAVLIFNSGHWIRNFELWGNPLGDPWLLEFYENQSHGLKEMTLSMLLNTLMHLGTPFVRINSFLEQTASVVSIWLGLSLKDSSIIFVPHFPLQISLRTHDTFAGNALMVGLFLGALVLTALPSVPAIRRTYALLCVSSWTLFCFLLKWSPFHTRLQTPLFILGAVLIGLMSCTPGLLRLAGHRHTQIAVSILSVLGLITVSALNVVVGAEFLSEFGATRIGFIICDAVVGMTGIALIMLNRNSKGLHSVTLVCLLTFASLPWLLCNETRPVLPLKYQDSIFNTDRVYGYFASRHALAAPYIALTRWLDKTPGCTTIGIKGSIDAWEYPLWALSHIGGTDRRFVHTAVSNASVNKLPKDQDQSKCAVVVLEQPGWSPFALGAITQAHTLSDDPSVVLFQAQHSPLSADH